MMKQPTMGKLPLAAGAVFLLASIFSICGTATPWVISTSTDIPTVISDWPVGLRNVR